MSEPISAARLQANQANAAKSTGPRTEAGKVRSRANSVKHGLRSLVVPVADGPTMHARTVGVVETIRPQTELQAWLCGFIAQRTIQLDRLNVIERQTRDEAAHRAEVFWEADQRKEAKRIAARLRRDPDRTVAELQQTVAGCDWLITQWAQLADLASRQVWTDDQKSLAHDLLGTRAEFRAEPPTHQVNSHGQAVVPALTERELALARLGALHEVRAAVSDTDEATQALAMADLNDFKNADLARVRRYGRMLWNDLDHALDHARHESPRVATNSRFLRSISAQFPAGPTSTPAAPNEPTIKVIPAAPNEPTIEPIMAAAPNEPIIEPIMVAAPNEPKVEILRPTAPNEPKFRSPVVPTQRKPPTPDAALARLSPELQALLEADLPDPDSLDPAWCREFIAARLGIDPSRLFGGADLSSPSTQEFPGSGWPPE